VRRSRFAVLIPLLLVPRAASPQGDPLGPEFRVNNFTPLQQAYSSVASGGSGFIVVWESLNADGSAFGVSGQRYDSSGSPLGTEFRVNTYTTSSQRTPVVSANASGNFVVAWSSYEQDGSYWGIFGQRFAASGAPLGPEFRVNTYITGHQIDPVVAVDPSGGFLVAWYGGPPGPPQPGDPFNVFAQRYDSSGAPAGPEFYLSAYTTSGQASPSVAADPSGNFVVVWSGAYPGGSSSEVFGRRLAGSGAPLGPEFRVNTYTSYRQDSPAVATDPAGNFVVMWTSQYQEGGFVTKDGVFGQRYASSGIPVGPEFRVNTYTTGYQNRPVVAADAAGHFAVVWSDWSQDGSDLGVFGQRYSSLGAPSSPEFRVNTQTYSSQRAPSVASDAAGNFLVTWHGNDLINDDVLGQRYGGIFPVELMDFGVE